MTCIILKHERRNIMKQVVIEATDYLKGTEDLEWKTFTSFAVTEKMIPKTSKEIRKYVLKKTNDMLKSNKSSQSNVKYLEKRTPSFLVDYNLFQQYTEYFNLERECLLAIRELLIEKRKISKDNFPINSSCGILLSAIENIRSDNKSRLLNTRENIISLCSNTIENNSIDLSQTPTGPAHVSLVKNVTFSINKYLK